MAQGERAEGYFTFDTQTGEIIPRPNMSLERHDRAQSMIMDLRLNAFHHLQKRSLNDYIS